MGQEGKSHTGLRTSYASALGHRTTPEGDPGRHHFTHRQGHPCAWWERLEVPILTLEVAAIPPAQLIRILIARARQVGNMHLALQLEAGVAQAHQRRRKRWLLRQALGNSSYRTHVA